VSEAGGAEAMTHAIECPMGLDCICGANDCLDLETVLAEEHHVAGPQTICRRARAGYDPAMTNPNEEGQPKQRRGFAAMAPERQRAIASLGGKTGAGHKWLKGDHAASEAGRKGGIVSGQRRAKPPSP
jgi:general stress protein YciG